jgi:hypothetical protein
MDPKGFSKTVQVEGHDVAIAGASFGSIGDIASKATGGGIVSNNVEGPTKFIGPGSLTVHIEGRNVQLLSDIMSNNNGPAGSPPNAATMAGTIHSPLAPGAPRPDDPPEVCPMGGDHDWHEEDSKTVEKGKQDNAALATGVKNPDAARGYAFENKAIDANMAEMDIKRVGAMFKCRKCQQDQEVDIVGKDQIAEAKSRKFNQVKKKGKQARRLRDIQQKRFDKGKNPRSKLDGSLSDVTDSTNKYLERGFDVEVVA